MQIFKSYEEARAAEDARKVPFVEIRRISDGVWQAYEDQKEVPPEPQT